MTAYIGQRMIGAFMVTAGVAVLAWIPFAHIDMTATRLLVEFWREYLAGMTLVIGGSAIWLWSKPRRAKAPAPAAQPGPAGATATQEPPPCPAP